jgi:hypothetical protein
MAKPRFAGGKHRESAIPEPVSSYRPSCSTTDKCTCVCVGTLPRAGMITSAGKPPAGPSPPPAPAPSPGPPPETGATPPRPPNTRSKQAPGKILSGRISPLARRRPARPGRRGHGGSQRKPGLAVLGPAALPNHLVSVVLRGCAHVRWVPLTPARPGSASYGPLITVTVPGYV